MKSVVFFISSLGGGGAERVCVTLANELNKLGLDIVVLTLNTKSSINQSDLDESIRIESLDATRSRDAIFKLKRWLSVNKIDLVVTFGYEVSMAAFFASLLPKSNFRYIVRNVNTLSAVRMEKSYLFSKLIMCTLFRAHLIINQCKAMEKDLITLHPKLKSKTTYIYNPVNEVFNFDEKFSYEATKINRMTKKIICVGRLESQKNFADAIFSISKLIYDYKMDVSLDIFGSGSEYNKLAILISELGLNDKVTIHSYTDSILEEYRKADVFLLSSLYEGFPNALLEAISSGLPSVAYDCPSGPQEIIKVGVNGYLAQVGNVAELAEKLYLSLDRAWDGKLVSATATGYNVRTIAAKYKKILDCNFEATRDIS